MTPRARTLVAVATYNEIDNLPRLVDEIHRYASNVDILVIDDNSPDGTGQWCDLRAAEDPRVYCLHRQSKLGLGTAAIEGFRFAIQRDYDYVLTMDADFSHHPRYLPEMLRKVQRAEPRPVDVMIGSRYVRGGAVQGWPPIRRLMSWLINAYARLMLGLPVKDTSGAFRCYRIEVLRRLNFPDMHSRGYSYLEEILWRLQRAGARFAEMPIVFLDRQAGQTKINTCEAIAALGVLTRLGVQHWLGL